MPSMSSVDLDIIISQSASEHIFLTSFFKRFLYNNKGLAPMYIQDKNAIGHSIVSSMYIPILCWGCLLKIC